VFLFSIVFIIEGIGKINQIAVSFANCGNWYDPMALVGGCMSGVREANKMGVRTPHCCSAL